jgi:hypothetical protein
MPDITLNASVNDHISSARLPIVDISPYITEGASVAEKETTQQSLDRACREFGRLSDHSRLALVAEILIRLLLCDRSWA